MNKKTVKIVALIPAKKNSQGLRNKNLKKLNNFSLFELAIVNAKKSKFIDKIFLSSDSDQILKKGRKFNIGLIKRKKSLCKNSSSANAVISDFIKNNLKNNLNNFIILYLQPTSPFRNNIHIDSAIKYFFKKKFRCVVSVSENKNFFKSLKKINNFLKPFFNNSFVTKNRQNFDKIYFPNGAIYIFYASDFIKDKKLNFNNSGFFLMNKIDSIDIDDKEDYELASFLSKKYIKV